MQRIENILLIRLSSIGDVLLTTPLIRVLRKYYLDAGIDFLTYKENIELLQMNPHLTNVYSIDRKIKSLQKRKSFMNLTNTKKYDIVVDLQNSFISRLIRFNLSNEIKTFNKRRLFKLRMILFKQRPPNYRLIPDLYIDTYSDENVYSDGLGLEFPFDETLREKYQSVPFNTDDSIIALAPGAFHFTKRMPAVKFAELGYELIKRYNARIVILGGLSDMEICSELASAIPNAINFAGTTSLSETAAIIDSCDTVITNDTSIMHIASARNVPVVAIFGSTVPELGFTPYNAENIIIQTEAPCRPCTHYGKSYCPKGHFKCMNDIEVKNILDAVDKLLNFGAGKNL